MARGIGEKARRRYPSHGQRSPLEPMAENRGRDQEGHQKSRWFPGIAYFRLRQGFRHLLFCTFTPSYHLQAHYFCHTHTHTRTTVSVIPAINCIIPRTATSARWPRTAQTLRSQSPLLPPRLLITMISPILIVLPATAFTISHTVKQASVQPVSASISTPV